MLAFDFNEFLGSFKKNERQKFKRIKKNFLI